VRADARPNRVGRRPLGAIKILAYYGAAAILGRRNRMVLFKYLPSKYYDSFIKQGEFIFRNLSYYKKYENENRNDYFEGIHRDNPDKEPVIYNLTRGTQLKGDFTFINKIYSDEIFVFCVSRNYSEDLYMKFECDMCIEFLNEEEILKKLSKKIIPGKLANIDYGIRGDSVVYYKKNEPCNEDFRSPYRIPFLKDSSYSIQNEYRFVFGKGMNCTKTIKQILMPGYDYKEEAKIGIEKSIRITIGNIEQLVRVHYR
jgi:hypothetical protein